MGGGFGVFFFMIIVIIISPSIIMGIIGLALLKSKPQTSKILFIIAGAYLVVSLGTCGLMMVS